MSWPSSSTRPRSGRSTPTSWRTRVVLPAPFGPSSPNTSPGRTVKEMPSLARTGAPRRRRCSRDSSVTTAAGTASSGVGGGTTIPVPVVPAPMQVFSAPSTDVGPVLAGYAARRTLARVRRPMIAVVARVALAGCSGRPPPSSASPSPEAPSSAAPAIALPAGPLRELVPSSKDLPPGMVPILAGTGPRDVRAVAGYSADPTAAQKQLTAHGFRSAYAGQYADPATGRVLSVVVSRFATPAGAAADLAGDLAGST